MADDKELVTDKGFFAHAGPPQAAATPPAPTATEAPSKGLTDEQQKAVAEEAAKGAEKAEKEWDPTEDTESLAEKKKREKAEQEAKAQAEHDAKIKQQEEDAEIVRKATLFAGQPLYDAKTKSWRPDLLADIEEMKKVNGPLFLDYAAKNRMLYHSTVLLARLRYKFVGAGDNGTEGAEATWAKFFEFHAEAISHGGARDLTTVISDISAVKFCIHNGADFHGRSSDWYIVNEKRFLDYLAGDGYLPPLHWIKRVQAVRLGRDELFKKVVGHKFATNSEFQAALPAENKKKTKTGKTGPKPKDYPAMGWDAGHVATGSPSYVGQVLAYACQAEQEQKQKFVVHHTFPDKLMADIKKAVDALNIPHPKKPPFLSVSFAICFEKREEPKADDKAKEKGKAAKPETK